VNCASLIECEGIVKQHKHSQPCGNTQQQYKREFMGGENAKTHQLRA
jgi:hypothetical protein